MNIGTELAKRGFIDKKTAAEVAEEAEKYGRKPEEILLDRNLVPEDVLFDVKSKLLKIPFERIIPKEISPDLLGLIPKEAAQYYQMVPLEKENNVLKVGMVYPEDLKAQEALRFLSRQEDFLYKVVLITLDTFRKIFRKYQPLVKEVKTALEDLEQQLKPKKFPAIKASAQEIVRKISEAPVSKIVAVILEHAVEGRASDIHIEPTKENTRVRFRLDGILHSSLFLPRKIHPSVVARIKIISNLRIDETRIPQDGRFSVRMSGQNVDFRVSTFPTSLGEKVVIRVLDPSTGMKSFEDLGLAEYNLSLIKEAVKKPFGSILSTGPTGSGKTTTLYSILRTMNKEGVNIVTLEDPIEYYLKGINQSQVRPEIGYSFASGLRHILRQDPDIIMVGEIRDSETASLATHAALTGHIVLSTLHTTNAVGAIPRLIDMGIEPYLLPPTLTVIIAQRLVRKLCPFCKKKVKAKGKIKEIISQEAEKLPRSLKVKYKAKPPFYIYQAQGCKKCRNKGYSGRIALLEVLKMTSQLADIISVSPSETEIIKEANRQQMVTMKQDGVLKALSGTTSMEEVLRVAA